MISTTSIHFQLFLFFTMFLRIGEPTYHHTIIPSYWAWCPYDNMRKLMENRFVRSCNISKVQTPKPTVPGNSGVSGDGLPLSCWKTRDWRLQCTVHRRGKPGMVGKLRRLVVSFLVLVKTRDLAVLAPKNQCLEDVSCRQQTSNSWSFFRKRMPRCQKLQV